VKNGTIKRMVRDKGFGFIRDSNGGEYFFHRSMVKGSTKFDDLREGDSVDFDAAPPDKRGPRAETVTRSSS